MSIEAGSVVRRAALHAALGDPGRLTIVDTLAWGEASPGELAAQLGMTSNLLAHHLRVLEDAGLLTRHRSEGDRRRSYVALRRAALDLLTPAGPAVTAERVVFVCTHNSARSQLAEAILRFAARGQPVYALRQTNGTAHLYFGAYESAQQAALAVPTVREAGLTPTLVYRIGRVF